MRFKVLILLALVAMFAFGASAQDAAPLKIGVLTDLSTGLAAGFVKDMTAGKGFIALAALIFAKWKPVPAMLACLLFGFLDAMAIRIGGTPLPFIGRVPVQVIQALPFVLTVILLAGFIGKAIPPRAGGQQRGLGANCVIPRVMEPFLWSSTPES